MYVLQWIALGIFVCVTLYISLYLIYFIRIKYFIVFYLYLKAYFYIYTYNTQRIWKNVRFIILFFEYIYFYAQDIRLTTCFFLSFALFLSRQDHRNRQSNDWQRKKKKTFKILPTHLSIYDKRKAIVVTFIRAANQ